MANTAVEFLLESLKELLRNFEMIERPFSKDQIASLCEELGSLTTFLKDSEKNRYEHKEVKDLVEQIRDVAHEAEDIIDTSLVRAFNLSKLLNIRQILVHVAGYQRSAEAEDIMVDTSLFKAIRQKGRSSMAERIRHAFYPRMLLLGHVLKEIKSIKKRVKEIYDKKLYGIGVPQVGMFSPGSSSRASAPNVEEETVVGFDHEAETIRERLAGGPKQLEVISIVGMAGLGKTTLARKLYDDPFIVYHFYIRGWTYVSQVYRKRDLLLDILSSVVEHKDEIYTMRDENLGEELYRRLKGRRYLIVLDDIWQVEAWNDLKFFFPNDNNGSRIMFTSRLTDVVLHAKPDSPPHILCFLTEDESWDLLQQKVFWKESCPLDLVEIGKQIAKKCGGLPLAIVVVAGLLAKTDKTHDWWKQVAESVSSYTISDPEQCMDTLALSYNHLPHHLKSCFLYFGAFPEDYEIPVRKLIWLWIAEGFIHQIGQKSLEEIAEEYLRDLIDRSLVLIAKRRCTGGIRACRVHDLLRDLCLRKAKEENFLQHIYSHEEFSSSSSSWSPIAIGRLFHSGFLNLSGALCLRKAKEENSLMQMNGCEQVSSCSISIAKKQRRLCIHSRVFDCISLKPSAPHIRSFLCFASEQSSLPPKKMSFICRAFKVLRVLDLSAISIPLFPYAILQLILLRYLALQGKHLKLPYTISMLSNLETLIVTEGMGTRIPCDIWEITKLRHLRIAGENSIEIPFPGQGCLDNLQTISQVCPSSSCQDVLARTPNLRKLVLCGNLLGVIFLNLDFLNHLETLKLLNRHDPGPGYLHGYNLQGIKFPPNLRRLTLSRTYLKWKEMSILGMLPELEVLKLEFQACVGPRWETSDGGFRRLKFLRFIT